MHDIVVSPEARLDQINIADYLGAQVGSDLSERFLLTIEEAFETLSLFPNAGASRSYGQSQFAALRMFRVRRFPYLIFYRPIDTQVQIVRIIHGAQDIENIFRAGN
jgi:toxin ParE1/3/4